MALKKTVSILCLLASTAMASTAPTYTLVSTLRFTESPYSGVGAMAYDNGTLYLGRATPSGNNAIVNYINNFSGASPALTARGNYTVNTGGYGVVRLGVSQGTLYGTDTDSAFLKFGTDASRTTGFGNSLALGTVGKVYGVNSTGPRLFKATTTEPMIRVAVGGNTPLTPFGANVVMAVKPGTDTLYLAPSNNGGTENSNIPISTTSFSSSSIYPGGSFSAPSTFVNAVPAQMQARGMTFDSTGNYLYVWNDTTNLAGTPAVYVFDASGNLVASIENRTMGLPVSPSTSAPIFFSAVTTNNDQYLLLSDGTNVYVYNISYGVAGTTASPAQFQDMIELVRRFVGEGTGGGQAMANVFFAAGTDHGTRVASFSAPQMTEFVNSVMKMPSNMNQLSRALGSGLGFVNSIAGTVLSSAFSAPSAHSGASFSFTPTQQARFKSLNQELPMLQFQSLHSLADPIQGPVNYATQATPFEQPKMTLKPTFLANDNHHIWIQPYGGLQRLDSYDQVTGYSLKTIGTAMGVGGKIMPNVMLGVLVGGALNSYTQDQTSGDGNTNNYYAGLYAGYAKPEGGFHVDGSAILGKSRYTSDRNISALGLVAKGSHNGWDASGQVQTGYKFMFGNFSVDPFAAVGARYSYQNSYQETNAYPFNLSIPSSTTKTATIELGAKFQHSMMVNETMVNPIVGLSAYREQPLAKQSNAIMNFTDGGNGFSVPVSNQIKTFAKLTVGVASMFTNDVTVSALVTGKIRRHEKSAEALVKVSYAF